MTKPLKIAVAGLGRMGTVHAFHLHELARDTQACELAGFADVDTARVGRLRNELGLQIPIFSSIEQLAGAGVCDATVVVTPTDCHREHAAILIGAGHRVLLEKPLTGTLEADREFAAELD